MDGQIEPYLREGVHGDLIKPQGLERINTVVSNGVRKNIIPSGDFLAVVVRTCVLDPLGGGLSRVASYVVHFSFADGILEYGYVVWVCVKVGADNGRYTWMVGEFQKGGSEQLISLGGLLVVFMSTSVAVKYAHQ